MGRAVAVAEIERLERLSKDRELTEQESWRLQKMLTVIKRLDNGERKRRGLS